jgi:hypothetical protein
MPKIIVGPCSFFGNIGGGIVSSVSLESEPGTSSAFAEDVPAAAVVVAAVVVAVVVTAAIAAATDTAALNVAFANEARGFVLYSRGQGGASDHAFRLPWLLPDVSVAGLSALAGVTLVTICGSDGNAA